jgi:hypothetical protein
MKLGTNMQNEHGQKLCGLRGMRKVYLFSVLSQESKWLTYVLPSEANLVKSDPDWTFQQFRTMVSYDELNMRVSNGESSILMSFG